MESGKKEKIPDSAWVWRITGLTRDGTAEPVSRDQFSGANGNKDFFLSCSAHHEQNWQPCPVGALSSKSYDYN